MFYTMYAKLFSRITESSLMEEQIPVRYTFVMLLAISDPTGLVVGTDVAIARRLNMPFKQFVECVKVLQKPDPNSNSKEEDGRRLIASDGERGYQIVNFVKYRDMRDEDAKRSYMRNYMQAYRARKPSVNSCKTLLTALDQEEAEASVEVKEEVRTTTREKGNPTLEMALGWALEARKSGADYSDKEATSAFHALNANGWMWGKNPVRDYRSALERQINTDRDRKHENTTRSHGKGADRNQGTYNERHKNDYANAAIRATPKVPGVQNPE